MNLQNVSQHKSTFLTDRRNTAIATYRNKKIQTHENEFTSLFIGTYLSLNYSICDCLSLIDI
jgi:hypothetical protein